MHMLQWDGDNQVKCNYDAPSWLSITVNNDIEINFTCTFLKATVHMELLLFNRATGTKSSHFNITSYFIFGVQA